MNPGRARAVAVIAAIAVGSALAGAGIDRWVESHSPRHARGGGGGGGGGGALVGNSSPEASARRRREMLERMSKDLDLTPVQRAGIDSVMQRTDSALRAVRGEMQPRLKQIFDGSRAAIAARLDSAQRVKFAQRSAERHDRERHDRR